MSDIPEDIRRAARRILFGAHDPGGPIHSEEVAICRAIMNERERCARVAESWKTSSWGDEHFAAMSIGEQIRSPK